MTALKSPSISPSSSISTLCVRNRRRRQAGRRQPPIAGREAQEDVTTEVAAGAADTADTEANALRHAGALMRQKRRIGRGDHDHRARFGRLDGKWNSLLGQDAAHRHAADGETLAPAEVGLDKHAQDVAAAVPVALDQPRGGADAGLESERNHPGPAADRALLHRPPRDGGECLENVLGTNVKAVDVVEPAYRSLGHDRQSPWGGIGTEAAHLPLNRARRAPRRHCAYWSNATAIRN